MNMRVFAALVVMSNLNALHVFALDLLHSLDNGATYSRSGSIVGDLMQPNAQVLFEREPLTDAQIQQLLALAQADGQYYVKLSQGSSFTSIRASCLLNTWDAFSEAVAVHVLGDQLSLSYLVVSPSCRSAPHGADHGLLPLPAATRVHVTHAHMAPKLLVPDVIVDPASEPMFTAVGGAPGSAGAGGAAPGAGGGQGKPQGKSEAKPDERTWWQKNWMFVAAGGLAVLNVLTKSAAQSGGARR